MRTVFPKFLCGHELPKLIPFYCVSFKEDLWISNNKNVMWFLQFFPSICVFGYGVGLWRFVRTSFYKPSLLDPLYNTWCVWHYQLELLCLFPFRIQYMCWFPFITLHFPFFTQSLLHIHSCKGRSVITCVWQNLYFYKSF